MNAFHTSFPPSYCGKLSFFDALILLAFRHRVTFYMQKLSTAFVDYSQVIHTRRFSEKSFSKIPLYKTVYFFKFRTHFWCLRIYVTLRGTGNFNCAYPYILRHYQASFCICTIMMRLPLSYLLYQLSFLFRDSRVFRLRWRGLSCSDIRQSAAALLPLHSTGNRILLLL